jgi:hypothetical protein
MGKSKPPAPPNPQDTASAQTGTNIGTSIANNIMGMVDQNTPYGGLSYQQTGTYQYTDPYTGRSYDLPRYTATTTLNDQQQATLDQSQAAQGNLASLANERSAFLQDYLKDSGAMTDQIDAKLYDIGRQRLDPRFAQQRDQMQTRLANQGIAPGSEAYNREMTSLGQNENDAYNQLILSGRNQAMGEVNAPINQITALLSGSQVSNPNVGMYQPQGAATTDVAGLINQNYNQRLSGWQQQQAQQQGLLGGLFGLGASALTGGFV